MTLDVQGPAGRGNPYVGPKPLQLGQTIFGRRREINALMNLLVAERIVLLYSPSGAGKTSLVHAGLLPVLEERRFQVLPVARVNRTTTESFPDAPPIPPANRYVYSVLHTLEEALPPAEQQPPASLAAMTLSDYFALRFPHAAQQAEEGALRPHVLIIDQFEEVLTLDPTDTAAKRAFFEQLGNLLQLRWLWALLVLREDHLAGLDPYRLAAPTRLANRFRLELLGAEEARAAIQGPARQAGVDFTDAAARKLVDSLRRQTVVTAQGAAQERPGPHVEPVQLQVVCLRLWERLGADRQVIDEEDVQEAGTVDQALADYYAIAVAAASQAAGVAERTLREWISTQLITAQGMRGQVLQEPEQSEGLDNRAIWALVNAHILRAEERRGAVWFELAHDRLVAPIQADNLAWSERHLSVLQRQAKLWAEQGRRTSFLIIDEGLDELERWAAEHTGELSETEQEFLAACQQARLAVEHERRQARRILWLAIGASAAALVALIGFAWVYILLQSVRAAQEQAIEARDQATANGLVAGALANLESDPELSLRLAMHALSLRQSVHETSMLHRAMQNSRVEFTLDTHGTAVAAIAFSPDGSQLSSAALDGQIKFWDAETGVELFPLPNHTGRVYAIAFHPDGSQLATAGSDSTVRIWSLTEPLTTSLIVSDSRTIYTLAFSPDGRRLATAGASGVAIIWDINAGQKLVNFALEERPSPIFQVAFSPNGNCLATVDSSGVAKIWDANTENSLLDTLNFMNDYENAAYSVAFNPTGDLLLVSGEATDLRDTRVKLWQMQDCRSTGLLWSDNSHTDSVTHVAFSPDGAQFATASSDGKVIVRDTTYREELFTLSGAGGEVLKMAYRPGGKHIATAHRSGIVKVWQAAAIREDLPMLIGHQEQVLDMAFHPDGVRLLSGGDDGLAVLWNTISGTMIYSINTGSQVFGVDFSPDGSLFALAALDASTSIWRTEERNLVFPITATNSLASDVAFSPDGARVAVGYHEPYVAELWDIASGTLQQTFDRHEDAITDIDFSADGGQIVTGSNDGTARVWDVATGGQLFVLPHKGAVNAVAFNHDGSRLLTVSADLTAVLWDSKGGKPIRSFSRGERLLHGAFSVDGERFVTASANGSVRVWDANTFNELWDLPIAHNQIESVEFSPDGKYLVSGMDDERIRQIVIDLDELLALAGQRQPRPLTNEECMMYLSENCAE